MKMCSWRDEGNNFIRPLGRLSGDEVGGGVKWHWDIFCIFEILSLFFGSSGRSTILPVTFSLTVTTLLIGAPEVWFFGIEW